MSRWRVALVVVVFGAAITACGTPDVPLSTRDTTGGTSVPVMGLARDFGPYLVQRPIQGVDSGEVLAPLSAEQLDMRVVGPASIWTGPPNDTVVDAMSRLHDHLGKPHLWLGSLTMRGPMEQHDGTTRPMFVHRLTWVLIQDELPCPWGTSPGDTMAPTQTRWDIADAVTGQIMVATNWGPPACATSGP
jgi:hypothetical protein